MTEREQEQMTIDQALLELEHDHDDGRALRDQGAARANYAEGTEWRDRAAQAIAELAASGIVFTAEDVREVVGDPVHGNAMGGAFLKASAAGVITRAGYVTPTRKSRHASELKAWQGATA